MTYDKIKIGNLITTIEKYISEITKYKINKVDDLYDRKTYHASSMVIFTILNKVIDLGNEILFAENLGSPNTYQDIMPKLAKANIINKEQADELNNLIENRNTLAHFYDEIDEKELFHIIKNIEVVKKFLGTVAKLIL